MSKAPTRSVSIVRALKIRAVGSSSAIFLTRRRRDQTHVGLSTRQQIGPQDLIVATRPESELIRRGKRRKGSTRVVRIQTLDLGSRSKEKTIVKLSGRKRASPMVDGGLPRLEIHVLWTTLEADLTLDLITSTVESRWASGCCGRPQGRWLFLSTL
jgi:hypothetical protein